MQVFLSAAKTDIWCMYCSVGIVQDISCAFTSFGDRIIRNIKLVNIAWIFMLRHFNELTCLPRTWASSYEYNENFMKKPQGMSRASQVKRSSPANRIGSHHINMSLFFVARTAR